MIGWACGAEDESLRQDVYEKLRTTDWDAVGRRLAAYGAHLAANYGWFALRDHQVLASGMTLLDVVEEAITEVASGEVEWDPDRGDLIPFLKVRVRSAISHLAKSGSRKWDRPVPEGEEGESLSDAVEFSARSLGHGAYLSSGSSTPEALLEQGASDIEVERRVGEVIDDASPEAELLQVVDTILGGCEPEPRHLAEKLGVPVADINNRLKRLRRRALKRPTEDT